MSSLSDALSGDDLLASLKALRDEIAADLEVCDSMRDKAALYTRLTDVLARIAEAAPVEHSGDDVDEIAERRAARRAGTAKGSARAKRPG